MRAFTNISRRRVCAERVFHIEVVGAASSHRARPRPALRSCRKIRRHVRRPTKNRFQVLLLPRPSLSRANSSSMQLNVAVRKRPNRVGSRREDKQIFDSITLALCKRVANETRSHGADICRLSERNTAARSRGSNSEKKGKSGHISLNWLAGCGDAGSR